MSFLYLYYLIDLFMLSESEPSRAVHSSAPARRTIGVSRAPWVQFFAIFLTLDLSGKSRTKLVFVRNF